MAGTEAEDMEIRCFRLLVEVVDPVVLQGALEGLNIPVPEQAVGKRKPLYKLLVKYLNSTEVQEADDAGCSVFQKLDEFLTDKLDAMPSLEGEDGKDESASESLYVKSEPVDVPGKKETILGSLVELQKIKELKISGKIGCAGEKDKLSYESLSYQIKVAKKMGPIRLALIQ